MFVAGVYLKAAWGSNYHCKPLKCKRLQKSYHMVIFWVTLFSVKDNSCFTFLWTFSRVWRFGPLLAQLTVLTTAEQMLGHFFTYQLRKEEASGLHRTSVLRKDAH